MSLSTIHQIPTNGKHGFSLEFSNEAPNLLALVANENYGISGEIYVVHN